MQWKNTADKNIFEMSITRNSLNVLNEILKHIRLQSCWYLLLLNWTIFELVELRNCAIANLPNIWHKINKWIKLNSSKYNTNSMQTKTNVIRLNREHSLANFVWLLPLSLLSKCNKSVRNILIVFYFLEIAFAPYFSR